MIMTWLDAVSEAGSWPRRIVGCGEVADHRRPI